MGNPLVTEVKRGGQVLFALYEHWGASSEHEILTLCTLISHLDNKGDVETLIRQCIECVSIDKEMKAGLLYNASWFSNTEDFIREEPLISGMIGKGIEAGESKASGLIAFTPSAVKSLERNACDILVIDLDGDNIILQCLEKVEIPEDVFSSCRPEELPFAKVLPFMKEAITKENAMDIMNKWNEYEELEDDRLVDYESGNMYRTFC